MVISNITLLNEMLTEFQRPEHHRATADDRQLLGDLAKACKEMQERIVQLIGEVTDEAFLVQLVSVNEDLLLVTERHTNFETAFQNMPSEARTGGSGQETAQASTSTAGPGSQMPVAGGWAMETVSAAPTRVQEQSVV